MGRISTYQKSTKNSAVLSGRTSAKDIVPGAAAAAQDYADAFAELGRVQLGKKSKETELDATNNYYDFVKQQSAMREQIKVDEGTTQDTEVVRDKILTTSQRMMDEMAGEITDEATKTKFLAKSKQHLAGDTESLNIWAYAKRRENLVNDSHAEMYSISSNAGYDPDSGSPLGNDEQFESQVLGRLDEFKQKLTGLAGTKQIDNMIKSQRKQAFATHFATRLENDPEAFLAQLQQGAYEDPTMTPGKRKGLISSAMLSAENGQRNGLTADTLEQSYKMNRLAIGLNSGVITRSQAYAEWDLAPEGDTKDFLELALKGQLDGNGRRVEAVPSETKAFNAAGLLEEMKAIGITSKPTLEKALKYKEIASKALLKLKAGDIGNGQYSDIITIANLFGKKKEKAFRNIQRKFYGNKMGEYSRLISSEDDPREYVLYRMLSEVDRDANARRLSKSQKQVMKTQVLQKTIEAFEVFAPDDEAYEDLQRRMQEPEEKERLYNTFAFALPGEAGKNTGVGYNLFHRSLAAALGEEYTGVVTKGGKDYRIVANSGVAQYIRIPEEDLQKMNRK